MVGVIGKEAALSHVLPDNDARSRFPLQNVGADVKLTPSAPPVGQRHIGAYTHGLVPSP